jgi:hypothetical protein
MMSIIKSVLFVWPLIPLSFFYSFINFIFVYKIIIYILLLLLFKLFIAFFIINNTIGSFKRHSFITFMLSYIRLSIPIYEVLDSFT